MVEVNPYAVSRERAIMSASSAARSAPFTSHRLALQLLVIYSALNALTIAVSLVDVGALAYTLDDPYIHLAVAENLLQGGYGINSTELSSPSSTMLYPLILAFTETVGLGPNGPLVVNLAAAGLGVYIAGLFLENHVLRATDGALFKLGLGCVAIFAMSAVALPMTGMEHSLHVLCVVALLYGLAIRLDSRAPWWLWATIILLPLIRFEGLAMALAAVAAVWLLGDRKPALACSAIIALLLVGYGAIMLRLGLPILPSSVVTKSSVAAMMVEEPHLKKIFSVLVKRLWGTIIDRQGAILMLLLSVIGIRMILDWGTAERRSTTTMAGVTGFALVAHAIAGEYGWFYRYEVYAVAAAVLTALFVWRSSLRHFAQTRAFAIQGMVVFAMAIVVAPYVKAMYQTPSASRAIYDQQYQMHRFATEFYREPVAANDIGWVSYRNPAYVLDLWGLGSEEVRRLRSLGPFKPDDLRRLVTKHDVELAMIYEDRFIGQLPDDWHRVAVLKTERGASASDTVSFFVFAKADPERVKAALREFKRTLPATVALTIEE
jgi:hypothetical protein